MGNKFDSLTHNTGYPWKAYAMLFNFAMYCEYRWTWLNNSPLLWMIFMNYKTTRYNACQRPTTWNNWTNDWIWRYTNFIQFVQLNYLPVLNWIPLAMWPDGRHCYRLPFKKQSIIAFWQFDETWNEHLNYKNWLKPTLVATYFQLMLIVMRCDHYYVLLILYSMVRILTGA